MGIWDVYKERQCLCTYSGHDRGIRDITFNNDGRTFVSSSFDKKIKVWDTEKGVVKSTICSNKMGYVVKIHPDADKQHIVLVGCSDKKIYQFDLNTGNSVQKYDRHLDAVNTITFIHHNRYFLSSSDDRTLLVWEYGIPEQIQYIADPSMYSIPYVSTDPSGKWLLMQSMNNTILTYRARSSVRINRNKAFTGHSNSGYGCQVGMSPDGRHVVSGDAQGKCFFWDWKTTRISKSIKAHEGACMGVLWHPYETSKVVSCGWGESSIKYWD